MRTNAEEAKLAGSQQLAADAALLNGWLQAVDDQNLELMRIFEKRFSPEYRVAFDARIALNGFAGLLLAFVLFSVVTLPRL